MFASATYLCRTIHLFALLVVCHVCLFIYQVILSAISYQFASLERPRPEGEGQIGQISNSEVNKDVGHMFWQYRERVECNG